MLRTTIAIRLAAASFLASLCSLVPAQRASTEPRLPADFDMGVVAIHTKPDGYGIWAGAPGYKVSFHAGFAFYPYGAGRHAEPWRWRTSSVRIGERELLGRGEEPRTHWTQRRFEYRYRGFVEAYDVRRDGVEQTFVIFGRPVTDGDLVVRGEVGTDLRAPANVSATHGGVVFTRGANRVSYGAAFAVDADGRKLALATALAGDEMIVRVPATWLRTAAFPVTVDPIIAGPVWETESLDRVVHEIEPYSDHRSLVAFERDGDVFAYLCQPDFSDPHLVYADMSSARTTLQSIGFVDAPRRWILAVSSPGAMLLDTEFTYYFHDAGNTSLASGTTLTYTSRTSSLGTGISVAIGGTRPGATGDDALVVTCVGGTVSARLIDARTKTWTATSIHIRTTPRLTWVSELVPSRGAGAPWLALLGSTLVPGIEQLDAAVVWPSGRVVQGYIESGRWSTYAVEDRDEQWIVAGYYAYQSKFWRLQLAGEDLAVTGLEHGIDPEKKIVGLAWDPEAQQLCTAVWGGSSEIGEAVRLSRGLCVIDTQAIRPNAFSVSYDPGGHQFVVGTYSYLYGYLRSFLMTHDPRVGTAPFGTGCVGSITATTPYAASTVTVGLADAPPSALAVLIVSPRRVSRMVSDGCYEYVDSTMSMIYAPRTTSWLGTASVIFDLPDCPVFIGQLNAQWFVNASGPVRTTSGLALYILP